MSTNYYEFTHAIAYGGRQYHLGHVAALPDDFAAYHADNIKKVKVDEVELNKLKEARRLIIKPVQLLPKHSVKKAKAKKDEAKSETKKDEAKV